jgi:hypothetical protein
MTRFARFRGDLELSYGAEFFCPRLMRNGDVQVYRWHVVRGSYDPQSDTTLVEYAGKSL